MLRELFGVIEDRKIHPRPGSYTNELFEKGQDTILQKIGEEAVEVILAAKGQGNQRLIEEISDLTYHILVLISAHNLTLDAIDEELRLRHRIK